MRDQSNWKATKSSSDQKVLPEKSSEDESNWKAILRNSSEYVLPEKSSEWEDQSRNKSSIEWVLPENIPMGYRFAPTEEELVTFYLKNRIFDKELNPVTDIKDIDEEELYSKPPKELVRFNYGDDKRQWFFFVNNHKDNNNSQAKERTVGKELGFWKVIGEPITVSTEEKLDFHAQKTFLKYFSGRRSLEAKKTHWEMEEYQIKGNSKEQRTLVKMKRGRDYQSC